MKDSIELRPCVYLIRSNAPGSGYVYYSRHGHFHGKDDVMCYADKKEAKIFYTEDEVNNFMRNELPEWTKGTHLIEELRGLSLLTMRPDLYYQLCATNEK